MAPAKIKTGAAGTLASAASSTPATVPLGSDNPTGLPEVEAVSA